MSTHPEGACLSSCYLTARTDAHQPACYAFRHENRITSDINLKEKHLLVRSGKGSKSRSLFLCEACVEAIRDWIVFRPKAQHTYLFLVDARRRLGEMGLAGLIEEAKSLADLRDHANIKPHAMRHAAATRLMRNGADLRSIQQFLGHSQLQTTAVYLHTDEHQLRKIAELGSFASEHETEATRRGPRRRAPDGGRRRRDQGAERGARRFRRLPRSDQSD